MVNIGGWSTGTRALTYHKLDERTRMSSQSLPLPLDYWLCCEIVRVKMRQVRRVAVAMHCSTLESGYSMLEQSLYP